MKIFEYGEKEISYLRSKDKRIAEVIDQIGLIQREVDADLFSCCASYYRTADFDKGTGNNLAADAGDAG